MDALALVGATDSVVGVDMTTEQLESAKEFQQYHSHKFGLSNVRRLDDCPVQQSADSSQRIVFKSG
jgi:hypothetical protein